MLHVKRVLAAVLIVPLAAGVSGCVWLAAGGAVAGVNAARQERTIGSAIDDIRIKADLEAALLAHSSSLFRNVATTVVEGRVLLTGIVAKPETRLDATRIAWSVEGVRRVDNAVEVGTDTSFFQGPEDMWIATQLRAELLADSAIRDINYSIEVANGTVYLMGVGQDRGEVDRAIAHARAIGGVKRVEDYVVLKDDPSRYGLRSTSAAQ